LQLTAVCFFKHDQSDSATDLGQQLLAIYEDVSFEGPPETLEKLQKICSSYPEDAVVAQTTLVKAAIKWSAQHGEHIHGHPSLHNIAASSFMRHEMFEKAQPHFLRGDTPESFAEMLVKWSAMGYRSERDLFLARAVLGYLALKNLQDANLVYERVMETVTDPTPLDNFLRFLLLVLERDAIPLFQELRRRYAPTLDRDPTLHMFLDAIGNVFYSIQTQQGGLAGMMGEMMKSFMSP